VTQVWRVLKRRHAATAFSGEGARVNGGRWNSRGVPMIYTSESAALAALEILVHVEDRSVLSGYVAYVLDVPEAMIEDLDAGSLKEGWDSFPAPLLPREIGDAWIASGRSLGLRVPSAVIAGSNVLLNPIHPAFRDLVVPEPRGFPFDARLGAR
jgi:RES domain-containing protein